ncbi:MAG: hypothetical protein ACRDL8_10735 [Solirubrobacteraceae bacterium]
MPPSTTTRPPEGLFAAPRAVETIADLFANVWQLGYATTDLDRALEELSARFGFEHQFRVPSGGAVFFAGDQEVPWEARFAMAARWPDRAGGRRRRVLQRPRRRALSIAALPRL